MDRRLLSLDCNTYKLIAFTLCSVDLSGWFLAHDPISNIKTHLHLNLNVPINLHHPQPQCTNQLTPQPQCTNQTSKHTYTTHNLIVPIKYVRTRQFCSRPSTHRLNGSGGSGPFARAAGDVYTYRLAWRWFEAGGRRRNVSWMYPVHTRCCST